MTSPRHQTPPKKNNKWNKLIRDYFPRGHSQNDSGIHAKLNYQVIADRQSRKLSRLMLAIVSLSLIMVSSLWLLSTEFDQIITTDDLGVFNEWMDSITVDISIGTGGNVESDIIEENVKLYWWVYFLRFILVRIFIASVCVILLGFLIKVYLRTRRDMSVNIQKEEALSAIHYFARGERMYQYGEEGKTIRKKLKDRDWEVLDEDSQSLAKGDPVKIELGKHTQFTTSQIFAHLPIRELLAIPDDGRKKGSTFPDYSALADSLSSIGGKLDRMNDQLSEIKGKTDVIQRFASRPPSKNDSSNLD